MRKEKRISARLSNDTAKKLKRIIDKTNSNMSEVIAKAIEFYFSQTLKKEDINPKTFLHSGFIGCGNGPKDLSENYKKYLTEELGKKL